MGCGSLACWPSRQAHPSQRTGISEEGYSVAVVTCECSAYLLTSPDASESVGLLACLSASGLGARTGVARNQQLPSIAGMCAVHACFDGWFLLPTLLLMMLPPDMLTASMNALEAHEMLAESVRFFMDNRVMFCCAAGVVLCSLHKPLTSKVVPAPRSNLHCRGAVLPL